MKFLSGILLFALINCGCRHQAPQPPARATPRSAPTPLNALRQPATNRLANPNPQRLIVTPESRLAGKVVTVNPALRFVIINYPPGRLPPLQSQLSVYRQGLKVGEIKVTGPQLDDNTTADIVTGEAQVGDEIR